MRIIAANKSGTWREGARRSSATAERQTTLSELIDKTATQQSILVRLEKQMLIIFV